jgi:Electron transfer DM13
LTVLPAFGDTVVRESFPTPGPSPAGAPSAGPAPPSGSPTTAEVVARGSLTGIDHRASGDVLLVVPAHGPAVVRLEALDVEPGPDYVVDLVPGTGATTPDGGVRLDRLRGNRGDQNYPVPAGTPLDRPLTVLIWCRAFAVPVAAATLS